MYNIFTWQYFLQLGLCIAIVVALVLTLWKLDDKPRKIAQISLIGSMGFFMLLEYIGRILILGKFNVGDQLPLDVFNFFVYLTIFIFFTKKISWTKFAYLIIAPVAAYNLIFVPNIYTQGSAFSVAVLGFVLTNTALIANSILNMIWSGEELEKRDILDASVTFIIITAIAHIINVIFRFTTIGVHANYFGTMGENYDMLIGWLFTLIPVPFLQLLPLFALLVGIEFLIVLPFDLVKTKRNRQSDIEELIALGNLKAQQEYRAKHKSAKSQILVKGDKKAAPTTQKNVINSTKSGFVATTKEVKVHKDDNK